jgi:hypothetical protein
MLHLLVFTRMLTKYTVREAKFSKIYYKHHTVLQVCTVQKGEWSISACVDPAIRYILAILRTWLYVSCKGIYANQTQI